MKVLLSILFILTGIYSCFFIEAEQIPFYKNYFQSWVLTLLISHLIPSFYLIIGFLLFFTRLNKILLYISCVSIFFFLIEIFLHNFFGYDINIICILVTLLFVIIFTFLNFKKINTELFLIKNVFFKKLVTLFFILISLLSSYIISPIAQYSLIDNPVKNVDERDSALLRKYIDFNTLDEESVIIALFSTKCNYCFESAEKIGITQKLKSFKKIISVFNSDIEDAKLFIENANYSTTIILSSKDDFLKLTDYNYPKFFVINKNGIISSYDASSFQERTIDKLSNAQL
tara:strand:- start:2682 stop:3542 length:861 start_codon:yes stop_codon:yes gene_type:complete